MYEKASKTTEISILDIMERRQNIIIRKENKVSRFFFCEVFFLFSGENNNKKKTILNPTLLGPVNDL